MYFFIDESGLDDKSKILVIGLVILDNPAVIRTKIELLKDDILHDPILRTIPNIKNKLKKEGFHYCEDHVEVKNQFIEHISSLSFQAYMCFAEKNNVKKSEYKELYKKLFGRLLFDRIRANRHENIHIVFERTIEKEKNIVILINGVVDDINKSHRKKVSSSPIITCSGKEEPVLSIADYVCGIFKDHYENPLKSGNIERRNFDKIRGRVRVIHNFLTDEFYTRKNLFP
jgi:hypothetical protein